jgi:hypothetical protein
MKPNWQQQQEMARRQQEMLRKQQEQMRQQQEMMRKQQEQMRKQQEQIRQNQMKAAWYQEQQQKQGKPSAPAPDKPASKFIIGGASGFRSAPTGTMGSAVSPTDRVAYRVQTGPQEKSHTHGLAVAALIAAVIGLVVPIVPIVAVIMGLIARFQIDDSGGSLSGEGISTAAVVLGVIEIGFCCIAVPLLSLL